MSPIIPGFYRHVGLFTRFFLPALVVLACAFAVSAGVVDRSAQASPAAPWSTVSAEQKQSAGRGNDKSQHSVQETRKLGVLLAQIARAYKNSGKDSAETLARNFGLRIRRSGSRSFIPVILEPRRGMSPRSLSVAAIESAGGRVDAVSKSLMRVLASVESLEKLALLADVRRVRSQTPCRALDGFGDRISESVGLTNADVFQQAGITGQEIKVAVVDLGFDRLAETIQEGELPSNTVGIDLSGTGLEGDGESHGAGVAEHVVDMAPGVELFCIKVGDEVDLENCADTLRTRGIRIANHSVGWATNSYYDGTGLINETVNNSRDNDGVFWAVSSGNQARLHWRGVWRDDDEDDWLNFASDDEGLGYRYGSGRVAIFLSWNQYGNSVTDLDLFVKNKGGTTVARSDNWQTGDQDPVEIATFWYNSGQAPYSVMVERYNGPTEGLDITITTWSGEIQYPIPESSVLDPASASGAFAVGAIDQADWNLADPPIEPFSSQGPTTDGRLKPEIVGPDYTSCYIYGPVGAGGTSFSSPAVAGAAALLLEQTPALTPVELAEEFMESAEDIGEPGDDNVFGAGKLRLRLLMPVSFATASQSIGEDAGTVVVKAVLPAASTENVTVPYTVSGTGANPGDHGLSSGSLFIAAGERADSVAFAVVDDALDEDDETVVVTMGEPVNARKGDVREHTVTIVDNDAPPSVSFETAESSGSESATPVGIDVSLSTASGRTVSVSYSVGGTADTVDHTLRSGSLVFDPGQLTAALSFNVDDDAVDEGDETVVVTLSDPVNATLGSTAAHEYTIVDNDFTPVITSPATAAATEDEPFEYVATAEDIDGTPTISFEQVPSWLTPGGHALAGTPLEGTGDTSFVVIAGDGVLADTLVVALTVEAVNDPPIITSPSSASATEDVAFGYTATASDPDNTPSLSFEHLPSWLDTSGATVSGTPLEGNGDTSFTVIASDGMLADTATVVVSVGAVNDPPEVTSPATAAATEDISFEYEAVASDPDSDPSLAFKNLPSWLTARGALVSGTPVEGDGDTSFTVIANDGELADTLVVALTVTAVNDAPTVTSQSSASATEDIAFGYTATASDPDNTPLLSFAHLPSWLDTSGATVTGTPLEGDRDTSFTVIASDGALADTISVAVAVTSVNDAPMILSSAPVSATEDEQYVYSVVVDDPDDANNGTGLTFDLAGEPAGMMVSPTGTVTWTPAEGMLSSGQISLSVADGGEDGAAAATQVFTVSVTPVNDPPVVTSPAASSATEDIAFSYTATADDPDDTPELSFANLPSWLSASGPTASGAPPEGAGSTLFKVIAFDGELADTLDVALTVTAVNDPPEVTSPATAAATEDILFEYIAAATDPDNEPALAFENLPSWLASTGSTVLGTPRQGDGDTLFTVVATDGALTDRLVVSVAVSAVNDTPRIVSSPPTLATEGAAYSYPVSAQDPDPGDNLAFSLQTAPAGMTVSSGGGISWVPGAGDVGTASVVVNVQDLAGASDTQGFDITVAPRPNTAPELSHQPGRTVWVGDNFAIQLSALDPDPGETLVFGLAQSPSEMSIDPSSGALQWLPASGDYGRNTVIAAVTDSRGAADRDTFDVFVDIATAAKSEASRQAEHEMRVSRPGKFTVAPNPAGQGVSEVHFGLEIPGRVDAALRIFDALGNSVLQRSYSLEPLQGSGPRLTFGPWDLTDANGRRLKPGTYLAVLKVVDKDGAAYILRSKVGIR